MADTNNNINYENKQSPKYETANPSLYPALKEFAKKLRNNPTQAESIMWTLLRRKELDGYKFRRQHIIEQFIPDFVCLQHKLIIEIDGSYHTLPDVEISDEERTQELNKMGYSVIRFSNEEVIANTDNVLKKIKSILNTHRSSPLGGVRGSSLSIKICGMRKQQNIADVVTLQPDYLGFIFFPKSSRYVGEDWNTEIINQVPESIKRVGVFVNENIGYILSTANKYGIKTIQLHGNETPNFCSRLQRKGYTVLKAFQVDEASTIDDILPYQGKCDFFLYDTKSKGLGGSGQKFDWKKLNELNDAGAFLLSGGITADDADEIKSLQLSNLKGVDINSKFEIEPALKDIKLLTKFIKEIRE